MPSILGHEFAGAAINTAGVRVGDTVAVIGCGGVDHAFEVIGLKPTAEQAIKITGGGGGAYQIGMIPIGKQLEFDPFLDILMTQRKYQGVSMGSTNTKRDIPLYTDLYQQGRLNLDDLVSKTIKLEDINAGYAELEGGKIARSVIVFD